MTTTETPLNAEWSHNIDVTTLPEGGMRKTISASTQECRDLARRIGVKAIEDLNAEFAIGLAPGGHTVTVSGTVRARVIQPCVVTSSSTEQLIDEPFEGWFTDRDAAISLIRARHDRLSRHADGEVPMLEESDDPEPIVNGQIDVGELAAQYLSLAVNPYPHAPGVTFEVTDEMLEKKGVSQHSRNPFAALKEWKAERKGGK